MLAAARGALPAVSRLARPISKTELYVEIQPLVILYGEPDFGQDETGKQMQVAWFDIIYNALKEHPREAIEIAVAEVIRTHKYNIFPKPAALHELALATTAEIKLIEFRLRKAVERADDHRPPKEKTPEDRGAVKQMIEQMKGADGHLHVARSTDALVPKSNRKATAEALRRLSGYR